MTTTITIDTEITNHLPLLNKEQKEAILIIMKAFVQEPPAGVYDKPFIDELNEQFAGNEEGKTPGFTWEETENRAREIYHADKI